MAGVVVGNWKSNGEDSFVKIVDHVTARSAPPKPRLPAPMVSSLS